MLSRFDKAWAATVGGAITTIIGATFPELGTELVGAAGTVVTGILVWLVPNRAAS